MRITDFSAIVITWTLMSIKSKLHGSTWPINSFFAAVVKISRIYWFYLSQPINFDKFVSDKICKYRVYNPDSIWFWCCNRYNLNSYDIFPKLINFTKLLDSNISHYARGLKNASNLSCPQIKMSISFMMNGVLKNISQY